MKRIFTHVSRRLSNTIIALLLSSVYSLSVTAQDPYSIPEIKKACWGDPAHAKVLLDSVARRAQADNYKSADKPSIDFLYGIIYTFMNKEYLAVMYFERVMKSDSAVIGTQIYERAPGMLSTVYSDMQQYDKAMKYALLCVENGKLGSDPIVQSANLSALAMIQAKLGQYEKAEATLRESLEMLASLGNPDLYAAIRHDYNLQMARMVFYPQGKYREAIRLCRDEVENLNHLSPEMLAQSHIYRIPEQVNHTKASFYSFIVRCYTELGEMKEAGNNARLALKYLKECRRVYLSYYENLMNYYLTDRQYDFAQELIDFIHPQINPYDPETMRLFYFWQSKIYENTGRTLDACRLKDSLITLQDTLAAHNNAATAIEMGTIYETAEKEVVILKQKDSLRTYRNSVIGMLAGVLILCFITGMMYYHFRTMKRKNVALYNRMQEYLRLEDEVEKAQQVQEEEPLTAEQELFRRIEETLRSEHLFTQSDLDRKTLAGRMGTNETYLANAIRNANGETFTGYITGLRLRHALKMLDEQPDLTFEAIAVDSGFGSYSPFFRAFRKQYGISPSDYRKLARKGTNPLPE